jgi:hypothetical protein
LRDELREAANGRRRRRTDRRTLGGDLLEVRALAGVVEERLLEKTARESGRWVGWAREALGLEAPWSYLRDVSCTICGGPLKVREDASSEVRCADPGCRDEEGRHPRWPRELWPFLLEQIGGDAA